MYGFSHRGWLGGHVGGKVLEVGVCATAASGFLLFGYDQGVMAGIITEPKFLSLFPSMEPSNKSGAIQALVVAIYEIGCLAGSIGIIFLGDKLGRRRSVLLGTFIMLIGTVIQATSFGLAQLIVGRIVTGIGNGMNTSSIPVWQSEMAPPKIRGFLVLFEGALITGGIMVSYWINYGFWFVTKYGSLQWRFPVAFQAFFGVMIILGILTFPESPRWLIKHGKDEDAVAILKNLLDADDHDEVLREDLAEIRKINAVTTHTRLTVREFFTNGPEMNLWRATVAFLSQAFQQAGGLNLVTYYSTVVFESSLGFGPELSRLMTACLGTEFFAAAIVALYTVDRLGRRQLMMWCALGMALSLMVIGICLAAAETHGHAPAYVATVFIFIFVTFFAIGWLGITWLYPAEVTPIRIRAEANGLSTSANWVFNYLVVQLAPIMISTIAWKTYFVFMCFNFMFIPVVYFYFPETNGYKLETLDAIFAEAHAKKENPVKTEKDIRKGVRTLDVEKRETEAAKDEHVRGEVLQESESRGSEDEKDETYSKASSSSS
ncbi:general substrate transporter [Pseudovirgaria hyperparasitica]|uniref:General substrate transporter n=1 Tax=Pseudovirgaria hyperparasitica TaxID=470096 RepID=A0A6A6VWI8_9PEZI|nr:general substrate transporter [Pseudovirgaria hyperparasitica]KAF2755048.1 general substrate transporter [Pseudovirgaria hyperparasitica]